MAKAINNVVYSSGKSLTAKLETSEGTWSASSGKYSPCAAVSDSICNIKLYIDGDYQGSFSGCIELEDCIRDLTMVLDYQDGLKLGLACVDQCGDRILSIHAADSARESSATVFFPAPSPGAIDGHGPPLSSYGYGKELTR